jgi:thiosulfate/3-mercaptopyruvate sulfurtransferase
MPFPLVALLFAAPTYPQPAILIEPAELARAGPAVRVLDARGKNRYNAGHVPGAVWVDAAGWAKAFTVPPDAAAWSKRLAAVGIDVDMPVVVYDDEVRDAARVWWILRYWDVKDVRLLNGGWAAWQAAGGKVGTEEVKPPEKAVTLSARADRLVTRDQLLAALKGRPPQIVDARSEGEYCGETETAKRNGAIPGAVRLEWTDCLDPKTKRFKPPEELAKLLAERHIDVNRPAVTYCQSGGRASVTAFALELMGGKQVGNYYKSWSEWGNADDTPVVKPPKK